MTATQMAKAYAANNKARQQTLIDSIITPELKAAMDTYAKSVVPDFKVSEQMKEQLAEIVAQQTKVQIPRIEIPQSLLEQAAKQFQFQNQELVRMAKKHAALFSGFKFELPEGYQEAVAAWRERLAEEAAADDGNVAGERLRWLAQEREAIIKCLFRIGVALEGFAYVPNSPVPPLVGFLFILAAVFGEVADEYLSEGDED